MFESVALPESRRDPALHSGGVVVPRVQGRDRLTKPPLIYWLQATSAAVLTLGRPLLDAIWMYRVPSLLAAIASVLLTWRLGTALFDSRTGRLGAALLACCPLVAWEARQARADMVLLALNTAAVLALWRVFSAEPHGTGARRWALVFWLCLALAILTKGPIAPLIIALTVTSVCLISRQWRWLARLRVEVGVAILLVVVAPWVIAVGERVGWDAYLRTIADETLGRAVFARESHWGPPGYHTILLAVLFWPGCLMTAAGVVLAFRQGLTAVPHASLLTRLRALRPAHPPYLYCLAWTLPAWLIFEIVATKLPHYTLPMYPAIALLSARAVLAAEAGLLPPHRERARRLGAAVWLVIGIGLAAGMVVLTLYARQRIAQGSAAADVLVGVLAIAGGLIAIWNLRLAWHALRSGRWARAQLAGLFAFMVTWVLLVGWAIPPVAGLSRDILASVRGNDPHGSRPLAAVGYHEDSLVFLTRARIHRIQAHDLDAWIGAHPDGLIVMPLTLRDPPPGWRVVGGAAGFNYSKGQHLQLAVLQRAP